MVPMKNLVIVIALGLVPFVSFGQKKKPDPIVISYTTFVDKEGDMSSGKYADAYYLERFVVGDNERKDLTFNYDKLEESSIKKIVDAYITYIQRLGSVINYNDYFSMMPSNPGSVEITQGNSMLKANQLGNYYFDPQGEKVTYDGTTVNYNGDWLIKDGEVNLGRDTIYVEDLETGEFIEEPVMNTRGLYEFMSSLRFIETWNYDYLRGRFKKNVKYLGLMEAKFDETGEYKGSAPFLMFETNPSKRGISDSKLLLKENVMTDVLIDRNACDDGTAELTKTAVAYNYIEPTQKYELLLALFEGVRNGNNSVCKMEDMVFDRKETAITKDAFFAMYSEKETIYTEDIETGELYEEQIDYTVTLDEIIGFKFVEDWYFDTTRFIFFKKVKYVGLLEYAYDEMGTMIGSKCRGFIKMN